jgi:hypothetical protein
MGERAQRAKQGKSRYRRGAALKQYNGARAVIAAPGDGRGIFYAERR